MKETEEDGEEQILYNAKQSGFVRDGPQSKPIPKSPIKSFMCSSCAKSFKTEDELNKHAVKHTKTNEWNCNRCEISFRTQRDVNEHILEHSNDEDPDCSSCGKSFETTSQLNSHILEHTNEGDWNCRDCSFQSNSWLNLEKHIELSHVKPKDTASTTNQTNHLPCNFSNEKFAAETDLTEHKTKNHRSFKPCRNLPNCEYKDDCFFLTTMKQILICSYVMNVELSSKHLVN